MSEATLLRANSNVKRFTFTDSQGDSLTDDTNNALRVNVVAGGAAGGTSATDEAAYTPASSSGTPVMGAADETAPDSAAEGTLAIIRSTLSRALHVNLRDAAGAEVSVGGGTQYTEDAAAAANPVGTALNLVREDARAGSLTTTDGDNVAARGTNAGELYVKHVDAIPVTDNAGSLTVDNAGVFATQVDGAALTALQLIDNPVVVDDAAFTPATTSVSMAGFFADETATDSVNEGDGGAARMTLDRKQIITPYAHAGAGGATSYKNLDVDETEDEVKATAGKLFWLHAMNLAATKRYLKIYNATAATVVVGTTVPDLTFPIGTQGDTNGAGFTIHFGDLGLQFTTAITIAATTGFADADTGAPGANDVIINLGFL
ncbi:MAG: hypothetical protein ACREV1_06420 [Gammaproteobacteria bacterium]